MLTTSVIILLREVLEISLMASIMLAISYKLKLSFKWFQFTFIAGMFGSFIYASAIQTVSNWFDGVGQEVVDASMLISIYVLLAILIKNLLTPTASINKNSLNIVLTMSACTFLAITREGYEVFIYIGGFITDPSLLVSVALGSIIGTGIGTSAAAIFYYTLTNIENMRAITICIGILIFLASGMLLQASLLLTQADYLPTQEALWDSSSIIPENTIPGQLLYALIGYEATPTAIQAGIYFAGITILLSLILYRSLVNKKSVREQNVHQ